MSGKETADHKSETTVQCWPSGTATRSYECDEEIPNVDDETMTRFGWGFCEAHDAGAPSGLGFFYACPNHRTDCDEEERAYAWKRNAEAKRAGR